MTEGRGSGDGRLGLTLVGGFLGAGKSTWLRHRLHEGGFAGHRIVVNEAAETPVDGLLLAGAAGGAAGGVRVLAGGCACCEGRAALVAALRAICAEADAAAAAGGPAVAGIVLETSGLADPAAIAAALAADPLLARRLVLREVLVLLDAGEALAQLAAEPLARAQVEAADRILLTRPLALAPEALARLAATLRRANPGASLAAAERGLPVPLPELPEDDAAAAALPPLAAAEGPILPCRLDVGAGDWAALSVWLSALLQARGADVVRVKGVVRSPAGPLLLQSVRHRMQPPERLPPPAARQAGTGDQPAAEEGILVLIGRNIDAGLLGRSWQRFGLGQ